MKPMLKPPGAKRLKLKYDELLSDFAFKFNLRRYTTEMMSPDERRAVLQFATGLSSPPAGGFRNLVGYMGGA